MTTTPLMARAIATALETDIPQAAVQAIRNMADQIEKLAEEIEGWKADQRENMQVAFDVQAKLNDALEILGIYRECMPENYQTKTLMARADKVLSKVAA